MNKNLIGLVLTVINLIALTGFNSAQAQVTYTVGGSLSGLAADKTVTLLNNNSDPLTLSANGGFTFPSAVSTSSYAVSIAIQPVGQVCSVNNGSGAIINVNISNVVIACSSTYTVGGSITGLTSSGLVLRLNSTSLIVANGATTFKFATALTNGTPFGVSVGIQPVGMSCSVIDGSGVINAANIINVAVTCNKTYSVGGTIAGLTASGLILNLNGGANKIVSSGSTTFTFATTLIAGTPYAVTIQQQPTGLTCLLFNASGSIANSNVIDVSLFCNANTYTVGGTITGLTVSGLVLRLNGANNLRVAANATSFAFPTSLNAGQNYAVTVAKQPAGLTCTVANGVGTIGNLNVTNVALACITLPAATILPSSVNFTTEVGEPVQISMTAQITTGVSFAGFGVSDSNNLFYNKVEYTSGGTNVYNLAVTMSGTNQVGTFSGIFYVHVCSSSDCSAGGDVPGSPIAVPYTMTVTPMTLLDPVTTATGLPEWSTHQGNAGHTGYLSTTLNVNEFSPLWNWSNPNSSTGTLTPVTTGSGKVVAVSSGYFALSYLYGIDEATGNTAWQYSFGSIFAVNHPAVADGRVFVASSGHSDTYLWSFDVKDGTFKYKSAFNSQWEHYLAPVVKGGYVYTDGGYYGGMYRFKESTGKLSWFGNLQQYDLWSPAVDDNYAYACTGYELAALNLNNGARTFTVSNPGFNWHGYSLKTAPVLPGDGSILAVDGIYNYSFLQTNNLIRYDISEQNEKWRLNGSFASDPVVANGVFYINNAATNALEARSISTGNLLWSWVPSESNETVAFSNLVLTDNLVFISTNSSTRAIDLNTHQPVWSSAYTGNLAISSNRVLYITSDNEIRAYRLQ